MPANLQLKLKQSTYNDTAIYFAYIKPLSSGLTFLTGQSINTLIRYCNPEAGPYTQNT